MKKRLSIRLFLCLLSTLLLSFTSVALAQMPQRSALGTQQGIKVEQWTYPSGPLRVKGKLYLPPSSQARPLIIFNHDGISGISRYHHLASLRLAKMGYVVFSPSYRGEDGSQGTVEIAKGEVDDVLNALPLLQQLPQVQAHKVILMGASHGALISFLAAARQPADISGVVFAYGVADIYQWWDYLQAHHKLGRDAVTRRTYGDGPEARPQSFAMRHALNSAPKIQAPVLILQGSLDDITPPEQGRTLAATLRRAGKQVTYREYNHCLHGFLVYAPYLQKGVTAAEKRETETAWRELSSFLQKL